jgi:DnaJ-domain-containing protein 1
MPPFLIALLIIGGGLWFFAKSAKLKPAEQRALLTKIAGGAMISLAAVLAFRGQLEFAFGLFAAGMGFYGKGKYLPNGFNLGGAKVEAEPEPPPPRGRTVMPRDEALSVLGLKAGASAEDIKAAHKRLLKDFHPDKGGSDYLAAKINAAKDVLLR